MFVAAAAVVALAGSPLAASGQGTGVGPPRVPVVLGTPVVGDPASGAHAGAVEPLAGDTAGAALGDEGGEAGGSAPEQERAAHEGSGGLALLGAPASTGTALEAGAHTGAGAGEPVDRDSRIARMFGYSGALRAAVVGMGQVAELEALGPGPSSAWVPIFGNDGPALLGEPVRTSAAPAPPGPGIYLLEDAAEGLASRSAVPLAVITTAPFDLKRAGYLNGYHIGRYPLEGSGRTDRYAPPAGFIEVTPENQDFHVSEHFRLRQFLTKDQGSVWPKYLALDLRLIDKLELVLQELNAMGVRADAMHVMSGFRTPQYNGPGGDGRATLSRHTYGDAADVWVDNDGDGYMDDLNGDGRADIQDARVMMRAVDRVERKYPALVGGAGVYVANSAHGPFIHIDVRGAHARW